MSLTAPAASLLDTVWSPLYGVCGVAFFLLLLLLTFTISTRSCRCCKQGNEEMFPTYDVVEAGLRYQPTLGAESPSEPTAASSMTSFPVSGGLSSDHKPQQKDRRALTTPFQTGADHRSPVGKTKVHWQPDVSLGQTTTSGNTFLPPFVYNYTQRDCVFKEMQAGFRID
ncbi:hypothetical protein Q5P01_018838 [Channa striata]|uniref:Uncharacterized protein n=1 Tax=Channa striata TaxID=64152 RepID=A0AA88M8Q7_CHASR|nr:hypothetical protein Q5P01_018838 [Channa striata]